MSVYDKFDDEEYAEEEYLMDELMLNKLKKDEQYREYFKKNLDIILAYNDKVEPSFCINLIKEVPELKSFILDNLGSILPKMIHRHEFYKTLSKKELLKNSAILFVPSASNRRISFKSIISILQKKKFSDEDIKKYIVNNIDSIITSSGYHLPDDMSLIAKLFKDDDIESPAVRVIDRSLAKNINVILSTDYQRNGFNYKDFEKYKEFKEEAKKTRNIYFWLNFPIDRRTTVKQCKEICEDLFGSFDGIDIAAMKIAKGDDTCAVVLGTLIDELVEATNKNRKIDNPEAEEVKLEDFDESFGRGAYGNTYRVGDFVIKLGDYRLNRNIPNHRRLIQPLIRGYMHLNSKEDRYVEIQNLLDRDWYQDMEADEVNEILYKIYADLRDSGIVWTDIKPENVGRLLKPNTSNYTFIDIDGKTKEIKPTQSATGMEGEIPEKDVLKAGEYVIFDTDYLSKDTSTLDYKLGSDDIVFEFEQRYQYEKELKKAKEKDFDNQEK